jgi:hypothetical protein
MRDRRQSSAQEALAVGLNDSTSRASIGGAVLGNGPPQAQRKWWAEQRAFLMEDLYPNQIMGTPTPSRNTADKREDGSESRQISSQQSGRKLDSEFDSAHASSPEDGNNTKLKKPGFASSKRLSQ